MSNATLTRSPERQALAAAISRQQGDEAELAKIEHAKDQARRDYRDAREAQAAAAAAFESLKAEAPKRRMRALMEDIRDDGATEAEVAETLRKAESALDLAKRTQQAIEDHERTIQNRIEWKGSSLKEALGKALQADPATAALVEEFWRVRNRFAELQTVLALLSRANALPPEAKGWNCVIDPINGPTHQAWADALAALAADPDAALPG